MLYIDNPLDRADHLRKLPQEIDELWSRPESQLIPYADGKFWVKSNRSSVPGQKGHFGGLVTLSTSQHRGDCSERVFLGQLNNTAWFALDYSNQPETASLLAHSELQSLRAFGSLMSAEEGAIVAYAQALLHWHRQSQFCQLCGHKNRLTNGGHVKQCENENCQKETFPRTDAAVIMLIVDKVAGTPERALLGRSSLWPNGVYSTLAGFVEPGETLEDAVRREVFEEAGIRVGEVNYEASQPWPFPQSIMLGFRGNALTRDIAIDCDELSDARWFTKADLSTFGNWGDERFALQLPRPDSISRHLINLWLNES